jgi:tetratricopeptide (TPR) repeat protein
MIRRTVLAWSFAAVLAAGAAAGRTSPAAADSAQPSDAMARLKETVFSRRKAAEAAPQDADAHFRLAEALGELSGSQANAGDFTGAMTNVNEAFAELDRATALNPGHFDAHLYFGIYAMNVPAFFGKLEPGIRHLETARRLAEGDPKAHPAAQRAVLYRFLGQGYRAAGRTDDAREAWEKTLALEATGANAEAARKGLDGLKAAPAAAQKPAPAEPADAASLKQKGKAALAAGRWSEAADTLRRASAADTTDAEAAILFAGALGREAGLGYDERIYTDQNWRTNLAFEVARELGVFSRRFPNDPRIQLMYADMCIMMPFFVGKIDEGLAILSKLTQDPGLPDSLHSQAAYRLGFGYCKKGKAVWADLVKNHPDAAEASDVYREFGLREHGVSPGRGERVDVSFHLGFQDELEPQTAVWVEDAAGRHVKTLYVSGFSGYAKEKQVDLPEFAERTKFAETDGVTGASIDWGTHAYSWNLTDRGGKRVPPGEYTVRIEASWWPSMRYETAEARIRVGGKAAGTSAPKEPLIPRFEIRYEKK